MALPKNFTQIDKRVESLNELTFYTVHYDYKLTDSFLKELEEFDSNEYGDDVDKKMTLQEHGINGIKTFSALDDETAEKKINEWLDALVTREIIEEYDIGVTTKRSFHETLKDKKLDNILVKEKRD